MPTRPKSVGPALDVIAPIAGGAVFGAMAGMATGVVAGAIATAGEHDSGPFFAAVGGAFGGLILGAVTGGVSVALGATPLLAIPAVIVGAAGLKLAM